MRFESIPGSVRSWRRSLRMKTRNDLRAAVGLGMVVLLWGPSLARAAEPAIRDDAGFFKPETLQKAMEGLQAIQRAYRKQVVIETFAAIPANLQSRFSASSDKE